MEDQMLRLSAGQMRIKRGRFAAIAGQENAGAVGLLDTRGPVRADVVEPRDAAAEENK